MDIKPFNIRNCTVYDAPRTLAYIPNFITMHEEDYLIRQVENSPIPKWTCLQNRRLQNYGGIPHKNGLVPEAIPTWLKDYMDRVSDMNLFINRDLTPLRANHCLVNEYQPGQGIMPHFDGPVFSPTVATISLGSHAILEFSTNDIERYFVCKVLLEPRSLVILKDQMYHRYLHGINDTYMDVIDGHCLNMKQCGADYKLGEGIGRSKRISLTIRNVPKVLKCNLLGKPKK